jgi:hypothetical protein
MKKVFSIFLSILMLVAVFHFSVATHYCGGIEVASKVSLTGKLADCGMENPKSEVPLSGTILNKHCCDNFINYCGIYTSYVPSFSFVHETFNDIIQIFAIPLKLSVNSCLDLIPLHTDTSPPGTFRPTDVDLSGICVFRI